LLSFLEWIHSPRFIHRTRHKGKKSQTNPNQKNGKIQEDLSF
jgi:hypothetical protein